MLINVIKTQTGSSHLTARVAGTVLEREKKGGPCLLKPTETHQDRPPGLEQSGCSSQH